MSKENKEKNFISYFQSVITIGMMSTGTNSKEAAKKARLKFLNKEGVDHCFFDQTDFTLSSVEEWKPGLESKATPEGIEFKFNPDDKTKNVIATRLQKNMNEMTDDDYHRFVKEAIQKELT